MSYLNVLPDNFGVLEKSLDYNVYIKFFSDKCSNPMIQVIEINEYGEEVIFDSNITKFFSKNILDLIKGISEIIAESIKPLNKYNDKIMLDIVLSLGYQIYFYKLIDDKILGTISKENENDIIDICTTINDSMYDAFKALNYEMYQRVTGISFKNDKKVRILAKKPQKLTQKNSDKWCNNKSNK